MISLKGNLDKNNPARSHCQKLAEVTGGTALVFRALECPLHWSQAHYSTSTELEA